MGISLSKGGRIDLSKEAPSLVNVGFGLGWDTNDGDTGVDFDLDASVLMIDKTGKIPSDKYFIFYNNLNSPDAAIAHQGDNRTGDGDGDDERLFIKLNKINPTIEELIFIVTIDEAKTRNQNFGQVSNAFIRMYDLDTNKEIAKYDLEEDFSSEIAIEFGRLYKKDGSWRFKAVGVGFDSGLQGFVDKFVDNDMDDFLTRVNTKKSSKKLTTINLSKKGDSHFIDLKKKNETLSFNLNWNNKANNFKSNGLFNKIKNKLTSNDLDLDLGCMYRLKNGQQGVVQALGNSFGSLSNAPYILLDGDDRSGANQAGETLHFSKIEEIDLAIVFAFIYVGAPNWKEASGIASIKQPNASDIIIKLNDSSSKTMVGIAILRNENSSLKVEKLEKYYLGHAALDKDFGFGFEWTSGSK